MWQKQLISIVEGNSLDPDHIADFLITYEAETGDESLRGCGIEVLMFMGALRPWPASWSRYWSGSRSVSVSRSRSWSWSGSRYWSGSGPRSRSGSKSGSGSGWSRSG
jgi:hypothetical protein